MKRRLSIVLVLVLALTMVIVAPAGAKKPLGGNMELEFNLAFNPEGSGTELITWVGTVELEDELYGIAFFPTAEKNVGTVHHFWEDWKIYPYDQGEPFFAFTGGVLTEFEPYDPVLEGSDRGVSTLNDKYHMNGRVEGAAAPFEEWLGRSVHMKGVIEWYDFGAPHFGPGVFRIN